MTYEFYGDYRRPFIVSFADCNFIGFIDPEEVGSTFLQNEYVIANWYRRQGHLVEHIAARDPRSAIDFLINGVPVDAKWSHAAPWELSFPLFTSNRQLNALGTTGYYVILRGSDGALFAITKTHMMDMQHD